MENATPELPAFGDLLRDRRRAAGLTQEALAERAGVSARAIADLERGVNRLPRKETLRLLADALRLSQTDRAAWQTLLSQGRDMPRSGDRAPERHGRDEPPLVGRARELELLGRHLDGAGPPLLLLSGEPGIGKSRLIAEAARLAAAREARVFRGGCQRSGGQEPYAPVLQALARHVRSAGRAQLRSELRGCTWLVRLLPELAGGPIERLPDVALPREQERRLTFDAVSRFLRNAAGPSGVALLLDDLQWAGADALDLVRSLVQAASDVPLRVVGAYRDTEVGARVPLADFFGDLAHAGHATHARVNPLTEAESARLVRHVFGVGTAAGEEHGWVHERLLRRAGGVPFFLVSCAEEARAASSGQQHGDAVPWSVAQSVRQRAATLPDPSRELLGPAAVIGRVVPLPVLASVVGRSEEYLTLAFEPACRARLLEEAGVGAYRFAHDVIREVVEADVGAGRRALLHRRIADALAVQGGEPSVEVVAYHYAGAEAWTEALPYFVRAGDKASAAYAHREALDHYGRALAACDRLGTEALPAALEVAEKRGLVGFNVMRLGEARADFARMASLARRLADRRREGMALVHEGLTHWMGHDFEEAEAAWRRALAVCDRDMDDVRAAASVSLGHLCKSLNRHDEASRLYAVATELAPNIHDLYTRALYMLVVAFPAILTARFEDALAELERGRPDVERCGQVVLRVQLLWFEALAHGGRGDYARALAILDEALADGERCGDVLFQGRCLNTAGWIHGELQDFTRALELNRAALATSAAIPDPEVEANARLNLGDALVGLGRWDEADEEYEAVERVVRAPLPRQRWMLWRYAQHLFHSRGELCLVRGDLDRALAYAGECLEMAKSSDSRKNAVKARRLRGQVFVARGEVEAAELELRLAAFAARRVGNPPQLWKSLAALGDLRSVQDRADDARAANREALSVVDAVAVGLTDERLRDTFVASPHIRALRRRVAGGGG